MAASQGKGGKNKGASFERKIAKLFTKWFQENNLVGEFYRTPASGGLRWQKRDDVIGDLCTPEGFISTIECKCAESWKFRELFQKTVAKKSKHSPSILGEYWYQSCSEAERANKLPILVFTKNHYPDYIMFSGMNNNVASLYGSRFASVGVTKYFETPEYLPYMEWAYILKLEDFMNIVDPKMLLERG